MDVCQEKKLLILPPPHHEACLGGFDFMNKTAVIRYFTDIGECDRSKQTNNAQASRRYGQTDCRKKSGHPADFFAAKS